MLVLSSSLNPSSRSRVLALRAAQSLRHLHSETQFLDARELSLPMCDGHTAFDNPAVNTLTSAIERADGIILGLGVYNFAASAAAKSLVELGGSAWKDKVVGFVCSSGGAGSYMAAMGLANSLMLDFRCIIVPRFVFATEKAVQGEEVVDAEILRRIDALAQELVRIATALRRPSPHEPDIVVPPHAKTAIRDRL